jgi:hypothetical protein
MKYTPKAIAGRITAIDHVLGPTAAASSEPSTIPTHVPRTRSTARVICSPAVFAPMQIMNTAITAQ